ncbi:Na+-driven multidrug efflux pump [Polymorphobacter multimanifer]|uniref:Na+-driven multidrug efflux pump n=3 Tax=Polymorphobacter multimanifer TaxID=1070431 RepID=A0A841L8M3_9SPHN|nr:Na+-driven multidrug efflux pump [Polymorphobacter multimanifer]
MSRRELPARPVDSAAAAPSPILTAPILPTLMRLALPNMGAMLAGSAATIAETAYVGLLGVGALAGMALVFPLIMLQGMFSAGAIGSGVSAAIAQALGAGERARAEAIAAHAVWLALVAGGLTSLLMLLLARPLLMLLGGRGVALDEAVAFAGVAFLGSAMVWMLNLLAAVLRGVGAMAAPSAVLLLAAVLQVLVGGGLGLGLGPLPRLGMAGVAAGQVVASTAGALLLLGVLRRGRTGLRLDLFGTPLSRARFADILRVGGPALISPLQTILTVLILTRLVASFGPDALAGYGIGTRLEFLMVPIAFAVGVASVPMVGGAIGAGDVARARLVAWTAGGISAAMLGAVGLVLAIVPDAWTLMFSDAPAVRAAASGYFRGAGPGYAFYGAGLALYFSSLAAGRVKGVVLAGTVRLLVVGLGAALILRSGMGLSAVFALVGLGMLAYGAATAHAVRIADWRRR